MRASRSSLGIVAIFILSFTAVAFVLVCFAKQRAARAVQTKGPLPAPAGSAATEDGPTGHCTFSILAGDGGAENNEDEEESADEDAGDKRREGGMGLAQSPLCTVNSNLFLYQYAAVQPPFIEWVLAYQSMECSSCGLALGGSERPILDRKLYLQSISAKTIGALFRILSAKIYRIIQFQETGERFSDSHRHSLRKFYLFDGNFQRFILSYHRWKKSKHKKAFITPESFLRVSTDIDALDYMMTPPLSRRLFHDLLLCRNAYHIGALMGVALGRDLCEDDCGWFDDLFELLYRLTNDEDGLADSDMEAYGALAFVLYPLHVKILGLSADDQVLFEPEGLLKLDTLLECCTEERLASQHNTTRAEIVKHAVYFAAKGVLDRRSSENTPERERCKCLLRRFMEDAQPSESVLEEVCEYATTGPRDPCTQVVAVTPLGLGFLIGAGATL